MRRFAVVGVAVFIGVLVFAPSGLAASARVAALQVALKAHGFDPGPVDGVRGHSTSEALSRFQRANGTPPHRARRSADSTRARRRGRPLLGQRELAVGAVGMGRRGARVPAAPVRARRSRAVDGRFTQRDRRRRCAATRAVAACLRTGSPARTRIARSRALAPATTWHVVRPGESFFSIAARYHVSPWRLARRNRLSLMTVIVPGQRLALPTRRADRRRRPPDRPRAVTTVRAAIDYWSRVYGVDPTLARALAWMESGFQQDVVSSVGALGVMQLLPETWEFVDTVLLGVRTPRTTGERSRRRALPALAARRVRRRRAARARRLVPGRAGRARARAVRRHEGVRPHRARALRHGLRSARPRRARSATASQSSRSTAVLERPLRTARARVSRASGPARSNATRSQIGCGDRLVLRIDCAPQETCAVPSVALASATRARTASGRERAGSVLVLADRGGAPPGRSARPRRVRRARRATARAMQLTLARHHVPVRRRAPCRRPAARARAPALDVAVRRRRSVRADSVWRSRCTGTAPPRAPATASRRARACVELLAAGTR